MDVVKLNIIQRKEWIDKVKDFIIPLDEIKKLLKLINVDTERGCWVIREDWSIYTRYANKPAHRLSFQIWKGPLMHFACHICDRRGCINPDHLFDGTHQDNMLDALGKKRMMPHFSNSTKHWTKLRERDNWNNLDRFCK